MKLQTKTQAGNWSFVFCRNDARVITTPDARKALPASALSYFQRHFANAEFRCA